MLLFLLHACTTDPADRVQWPAFLAAQPGPLVFAHRGGGGLRPENTLAAFANLLEHFPNTIVEFDVHRSRDGILFVVHDDSVDRTTAGRGQVEDLTSAQLQSLDAGFCFDPTAEDGTAAAEVCASRHGGFPLRNTGLRIPTLDEVLAVVPRTRFISIEVKSDGIEDAVIATLEKASWPPAQVALGSLDDDRARKLKKRWPDAAHYAPLGTAACHVIPALANTELPSCPRRYDILAVGLSKKFHDADVIRIGRKHGHKVVFFTINDPLEMEDLLLKGADGLITDFPDRAESVIARLRAAGRLP